MLGGYSADGKTFTHTFTVHQVEKKYVVFAITLCSLLYGKKREVVTSYPELVGEEDYRMRMLRYDVELQKLTGLVPAIISPKGMGKYNEKKIR